ncbi:hypothetical protein OAE61_05380, partial [Verrucomicrobiales bacterium]|nr:hypothetical protein [Verrucomicrobiales bacterium]
MKIKVIIALVTLCSSVSFGRPFKDTKNRVINAEIKSVSGEEVTIVRDADNKEFTIPITSLSQVDQEFIKSWV